MPVHERLLRTVPAYAEARIASENAHALTERGLLPLGRTGITSIPVVVHVLHNVAAQNISDAQIQSQIDVLNRDYRMTNADIGSVPAAFKPLAADARLQFTLASTDPNGAATNGITRTQTAKTSFADDDGAKSAATGGHDAWPADRYLNIWTVPRLTSPQGDLLGYAQFPGGPAATDGVVILHSAFGTTGSAAAPFNLGRTATHEIGHWLNLRHIWGDDGNGCNGSDFVNDTPNQAGPNFGKPAFPHATCNNGPNGDMFMNYMDYVDDAAMFMFTAGQVVRMQTSLDHDRPTIGTNVPGPTLPSLDVTPPPTLKFRDDQPPGTLAILDVPPGTLKFRDDMPPTLKFRDDLPPPTLKFRDDQPPGTLAFLDVPPGTLKFRDDIPPSLKFRDDATTPPGLPPGPGPLSGGPFGGGWFRAGPPPAPFVLSTPHHSMAWTQSFPDEAQQAMAMSQQQIAQYEEQLNALAQADAAGQLQPADQQMADALYQDYLALVDEYRQTFGG